MSTTINPAIPPHTLPERARAEGDLSTLRLWIGRVLTGAPLTLLAFDGLVKVLGVPAVVAASAKLGFERSTLGVIGAVELFAVLCFFSRRTAVLGAALVTAYLGGAVCTHVRQGDPLVSHVLVPVYFAAAVWGGLYLRDARVRALSPFHRNSDES